MSAKGGTEYGKLSGDPKPSPVPPNTSTNWTVEPDETETKVEASKWKAFKAFLGLKSEDPSPPTKVIPAGMSKEHGVSLLSPPSNQPK